ncbi:MAG: hypothetical protein JW809_13325 [Pirellulales bacterium]|nr:hypothetical protein [Pirellulales bacterium]
MVRLARIPDKPRPRDYFSRREQGRLLLLVGALGLVVILAVEARKPANWTWFARLDESAASQEPPLAPPRHADPVPEDEPGTIRLAGPDDDATAAEPVATEPPVKPPGEPKDRRRPDVPAEWLAAIKDNTVLRPAEDAAWFGLLKILARTEPAALAKASIGRVTRIELFEQLPAYRGELVTVRGTVRGALRKEPPSNAAGIARYDQLWIEPEDSPGWPVVVYCLELPEGFPTGDGLAEPVAVTGFVFKRWLYRSKRGMEVAPLLLARGVDWRPRPPGVPAAPPRGTDFLWAAAVALLVAVAVTYYVHRRTRRRGPREENR